MHGKIYLMSRLTNKFRQLLTATESPRGLSDALARQLPADMLDTVPRQHLDEVSEMIYQTVHHCTSPRARPPEIAAIG